MSSVSASALLALLVLAVIMAFVSAAPQSCGPSEHDAMPCVCCKKDCWYTVAAAATHELGHMPGEAGEAEAMATLRLIRACMMSECAAVCAARPF